MDQKILDIISIFKSLNVVVAGDVMLDRFVYGSASRLSPEAPVPVLNISRQTDMPGGAGNAVTTLQGLGAEVSLLSVIGQDSEGKALKALLDGAASGLVEADRPTTVKTRFVASGQHMLRVDYEDVSAITVSIEDSLLKQAEAMLVKANVLILSDYRKGVLTPRVAKELIVLAKKRGIQVLADPKGGDYSLYRGVDVVTPNVKELQEATDMEVCSEDNLIRAARSLIDMYGFGAVIVTRSENGVTVVQGKNAPVHMKAEARFVADVSGVGDTLIATAALALAAGATPVQAASIGNTAASIAVEKQGTARISLQELQARLTGGASHTAPDKNTALEIVRGWQASGLKVGFTNGCFDILHPGHVGYLAAARAKCDRLVIGLNADESVRRLKGPTRPVNDEQSRAAVLAALRSVDLVVLFGQDKADEDKPVRLVETLKPDILFKGGDYTEDQMPEAKAARAYGGDVAIMPLHEGHSTTATIGRMAGGKS